MLCHILQVKVYKRSSFFSIWCLVNTTILTELFGCLTCNLVSEMAYHLPPPDVIDLDVTASDSDKYE